jgi:hypothetical protein
MTGSPQRQQELTPEQAVERARNHRDEFVAGASVFQNFAPDGSDDDYQGLQRDLERAAPPVSESAWGHEYFSLLFLPALMSGGTRVGTCTRSRSA